RGPPRPVARFDARAWSCTVAVPVASAAIRKLVAPARTGERGGHVDVGLFVPLGNGNASPDLVRAVGREAEDRGFESIWLPEHVVLFDEYASSYPYAPDGRLPTGPDAGMLEPLNALTFLAGVTDRV